MNNYNPPITALRPNFGRRHWRFGRMRAGSYCPALRAECLLSACSSRSLFAGYIHSQILIEYDKQRYLSQFLSEMFDFLQ